MYLALFEVVGLKLIRPMRMLWADLPISSTKENQLLETVGNHNPINLCLRAVNPSLALSPNPNTLLGKQTWWCRVESDPLTRVDAEVLQSDQVMDNSEFYTYRP
ncbi:hypothetical protein Tco_0347677, partial [Tanacetum coccineum]